MPHVASGKLILLALFACAGIGLQAHALACANVDEAKLEQARRAERERQARANRNSPSTAAAPTKAIAKAPAKPAAKPPAVADAMPKVKSNCSG